MLDAYDQGASAQKRGDHCDSNPHPSGTQERIDFFNGFYDAKHEQMFPNLKLLPVGRGKCLNG